MLFAQAAWAETEEGNGAPDKAVLMSSHLVQQPLLLCGGWRLAEKNAG